MFENNYENINLNRLSVLQPFVSFPRPVSTATTQTATATKSSSTSPSAIQSSTRCWPTKSCSSKNERSRNWNPKSKTSDRTVLCAMSETRPANTWPDTSPTSWWSSWPNCRIKISAANVSTEVSERRTWVSTSRSFTVSWTRTWTTSSWSGRRETSSWHSRRSKL